VGNITLLWDTWRAPRGGVDAIAARQRARLEGLIAHARAHSGYYQRLYAGLPTTGLDLPDLPVVSKPRLMDHFDEWVTDPSVTRAGVEAFAADTARIGEQYLGRYAVWSTSGTTGRPGLFLHDRTEQALYTGLLILRGWPSQLRAHEWARLVREKARQAFVVATGGHYASIGYFMGVRRGLGIAGRRLLAVSALLPLAEIVEQLNRFQPTFLAGYPSALTLLAREQAAGRLAIRPVAVSSGGETVDRLRQAEIEGAFGCRLYDMYGTSEFLFVAFTCRHGWHHVNADWVILEPVDAQGQPVSPGVPSHSVLLTNLANRLQPLIRYDLGDSVTFKAGPCACGSSLPAIHVEGRRDEILQFETASGERAAVLPLGLAAVIEEVPGVQRYQAIQVAPDGLKLRLEVRPTAGVEPTWTAALERVRDFLAGQGLGAVWVQRAPEPPEVHPASGKFRQVWSEVERTADRRPQTADD
jgi:putative adenylate-forming enzyme